jgi:SAM-dependent methyltransferase
MISSTDVEYAYRLFLGRDPESADVVKKFVETTKSLADLRKLFLASPEFRVKSGQDSDPTIHSIPKPLNWTANSIDVNVPPDDVARLIRRVETTWEQLGREEPHWSVLTHDKFKLENIGDNETDFFQSGERAAALFRASAERCGVDLGAFKSCFELGCGVGRVTLWLSRMFQQVIAADISASHLKVANEALANFKRTNVTTIKLVSLQDLEACPEFDAFFSVIVLQHNPPPIMAYLLSSILKKLNPSGIGYFQIPTYSKGYRFEARSYLAGLEHERGMEMHVLPQPELFRLLEQSGCDLLEIREDSWTGDPNMVSNSVLVRKRPVANGRAA